MAEAGSLKGGRRQRREVKYSTRPWETEWVVDDYHGGECAREGKERGEGVS